MPRILFIPILAALLIPPSWAGEGYKEVNSGATVLLAGYGTAWLQIHSSPTYRIDINRRIHMVGQNPEWVTRDATHAEIRTLANQLNGVMGLFENLPSARLDFSLGYYVAISSRFSKDGRSVATLAGGTYGPAGQGGGHLQRDSNGVPVIVEFDLTLRRQQANVTAQAVLAQELGHGIGLNHSWLVRDSVTGFDDANFTGADSPASIMSYSGGAQWTAPINSGVLNPDDVALVCRLYPDLSNPLSRSTGAVRGVAIDAGGAELYGANVLLVERATGRALVSRISGYATSRPNGAKNGIFELDGVPPGRYDVLVAHSTDALVPNANPEIQWMKLDGGATSWPDVTGFSPAFDRAWVRDVAVNAGQLTDVGYVEAGTDRAEDRPSRLDVEVSAPTGHTYYWYDFWGANPWQMAHRSGTVQSATYSARLRNQDHAIRIWAYSGGRWIVLQDWLWRRIQSGRLSFGWGRMLRSDIGLRPWPVSLQVECFEYIVDITRPAGSRVVWAPCHARWYVGYVATGSVRVRVLAQFNTSEQPVTARSSTFLTVR